MNNFIDVVVKNIKSEIKNVITLYQQYSKSTLPAPTNLTMSPEGHLIASVKFFKVHSVKPHDTCQAITNLLPTLKKYAFKANPEVIAKWAAHLRDRKGIMEVDETKNKNKRVDMEGWDEKTYLFLKAWHLLKLIVEMEITKQGIAQLIPDDQMAFDPDGALKKLYQELAVTIEAENNVFEIIDINSVGDNLGKIVSGLQNFIGTIQKSIAELNKIMLQVENSNKKFHKKLCTDNPVLYKETTMKRNALDLAISQLGQGLIALNQNLAEINLNQLSALDQGIKQKFVFLHDKLRQLLENIKKTSVLLFDLHSYGEKTAESWQNFGDDIKQKISYLMNIASEMVQEIGEAIVVKERFLKEKTDFMQEILGKITGFYDGQEYVVVPDCWGIVGKDEKNIKEGKKCGGHAVYVAFRKEGNYVKVIIYNGGAGSEHHRHNQASPEEVYPKLLARIPISDFVGQNPKILDYLSGLICDEKSIFQPTRTLATVLQESVYNFGLLADLSDPKQENGLLQQEIADQTLLPLPEQKAGNCTVRSWSFGCLSRLGRDLYEMQDKRELTFAADYSKVRNEIKQSDPNKILPVENPCHVNCGFSSSPNPNSTSSSNDYSNIDHIDRMLPTADILEALWFRNENSIIREIYQPALDFVKNLIGDMSWQLKQLDSGDVVICSGNVVMLDETAVNQHLQTLSKYKITATSQAMIGQTLKLFDFKISPWFSITISNLDGVVQIAREHNKQQTTSLSSSSGQDPISLSI